MGDFNSLHAAAKYADVSHETIRIWCKKYRIGKQDGRRWTIYRDRLDRILAARDVLLPAA